MNKEVNPTNQVITDPNSKKVEISYKIADITALANEKYQNFRAQMLANKLQQK
jgi:hypothetical protein